MAKRKSLWLWLIALLLTVFLAVYQRLTGPTHPLRGFVEIGGAKVAYTFLRSATSHEPLPVRVSGHGIVGLRLLHRRYPLLEGEAWGSTWTRAIENDSFRAFVPGQPAAGKVAYKVEVMTPAGAFWLNGGRPIVARFKDAVPDWLLILHIVFMFAGLLLAFRTGLESLRRDGRREKWLAWTLAVTFFGGLILGPLVQKFAFGAYWTGFPLGGDLTDSKTLFVVLVWFAAFLLRKKSRWWTLGATGLMVLVYLVPHSLLGSELNYRTGEVGTSKIITK